MMSDSQFGHVVFVTGFHRSGTTVLTDAIAAATGGTRLTAGHLAKHLPRLEALLASLEESGDDLDRGVDRLEVKRSLTEEYCWYLYSRAGRFRYSTKAKDALERLIASVAPERGILVMKNPWDTGNEHTLLADFPGARVVVIRRSLPEIEASLRAALIRTKDSRYLRALMNNSVAARAWLWTLGTPGVRQAVITMTVWRLRLMVVRLAWSSAKTSDDRITFLSYGDLRDYPARGAEAARRLCVPERLADAFSALYEPVGEADASRSFVMPRLLDRYWRWSCLRAQARRPCCDSEHAGP
jgi:Sulfotransferase family